MIVMPPVLFGLLWTPQEMAPPSGVKEVQFYLDGQPFGVPLTSGD
jgi:hypothetical protein